MSALRTGSAAFHAHFDRLVEREIAALPPPFRAVLDRLPVLIEDAPSSERMQDLGLEADDDLCGLHEGVPDTETDDLGLPGRITLWRNAIAEQAGWPEDGHPDAEDLAALAEEIHITLLHELGHQLGLDEEDMERLGYA